MERASEYEFLYFFYEEFARDYPIRREEVKRLFLKETGKNLPLGYNFAQDGENLDKRA